MLELSNGAIVEASAQNFACQQVNAIGFQSGSNTIGGLGSNSYPYQTHWYSYPVYVCSDKTAKAIEILKALQADKILEVKSVPKFIELVEKISGIL